MLLVAAGPAACAEPLRAPSSASAKKSAFGPPTISLLPSSTGTMMRSYGGGSASIDLGRVSYFEGARVPGSTSRKSRNSFVISTRFGLKIDCADGTRLSPVDVTVFLLDSDLPNVITVDGMQITSLLQPLTTSFLCGSTTEHRLDVEVPTSAPDGAIGSTVGFQVAARN
jgi:hypothetical protein